MESKGLIDMDFLQHVANIKWAASGDSDLALQLSTAQLVGDIYKRLSDDSELDAIRNETIMKITKFVKDNPKSSKEQLSKEIGKEIEAFAKKVESL